MSALQTQQLYGEQSTDNVGPSRLLKIIARSLDPRLPPSPAQWG